MSFQKIETNSFCIGQIHYSGTKNIAGEIIFDEKTDRQDKLLVRQRSICKRKRSMIVSYNAKQAEGLIDVPKSLGKKGPNLSKKMPKNVLEDP